eukprot:jgi/Mesvir1/20825/Mv07922-RA.1
MSQSEYEQMREARIRENQERLRDLNMPVLTQAFRAIKPRPPMPPKLKAEVKNVAGEEIRRSSRVAGVPPVRYSDDVIELQDKLDCSESLPRNDVTVQRAPRVGAWAGQASYQLPTLYIDGVAVERNKSCHVCTQCDASWRGNFPPPLGCSTCRLVWCSRCLFHINGAATMEEVDSWIQDKQATGSWRCLKCLGMCACDDDSTKGLSKIDRHKVRGWVGVTGGFASHPARRATKRTRLLQED